MTQNIPMRHSSPHGPRFRTFQVTICDEYQDPVDLIAELKTSHAMSGSDGCLEDMYSTPYASMNLGECSKI